MAYVDIEIKHELQKTLKLLDRLPRVLQKEALRAAVRNSGNIVVRRARALAPQPGYPGDKPGLTPLRDTIGLSVRMYDTVAFAAVGPEYPAGAHGHLVEFGHEKWLWGVRADGRVPDYPFLERAADETMAQQKRSFEKTVRNHMDKYMRANEVG